jgi:hypothetical protein
MQQLEAERPFGGRRDVRKIAGLASADTWLDKNRRSVWNKAMKSVLDNFAAVLGSFTVAMLLVSVAHEYGYFLAIGQHFQTILSTTDYFSNAVLWLPLMVGALLIFLDWDVMFGSKRFAPLGWNWSSALFALVIFGLPTIDFFFFPLTLTTYAFSAILLWLMYGTRLLPFENNPAEGLRAVRRALVVVPVVVVLLFAYGYGHGKSDLKSFDSPYDVDLKSNNRIHRVLLRTFDKGILVRDAVNDRVEFVRWDDITKLSRVSSIDSRPLACRWFGLNCPDAPNP